MDESQGRGGDGGQLTPQSPAPRNGPLAGRETGGKASEQQDSLGDDGLSTSSSQAARDLFYRRAEGGRRDVRGAGNAVIVGGTGSPYGGVVDAAANKTLGTPPRELELNNSVFWPDPIAAGTGRGEADGSNFSGGAGEAPGMSKSHSSWVTAPVGTASSTAESSSLPSAATSALVGGAPKLLDFFNMQDEASSRQFRAARDYMEGFRELDLDRAILERGLGVTGERLVALDLPLMARYTFQVIGGARA